QTHSARSSALLAAAAAGLWPSRASAEAPRAAAESAAARSTGIEVASSGRAGRASRPPEHPARAREARRSAPAQSLSMEKLPFLEAGVRILRDHDVIEDVDPQDPPRLHQP